MAYEALKDYRCGEPVKSKHEPIKAIASVLTKHHGPHARLFKGGIYNNLHPAVVAALVKDKGLKEV